MNRITLPLLCSLGLFMTGAAIAQTDDAGWRELQSCVTTLLNTDSASFQSARTFRITLPQERAAGITVQLLGDQLTFFQCRNYVVSANPAGRGHAITSADGKRSRPLTFAEVRGFRSYLSLDPYWVLCHLHRDFTAFTFTVTDDGRGVFDRWEMVSLADPGEQLYGVIQETVAVDLATHQVLSYALLALDPDGVPLQDLLNLYGSERTAGAAALVVTQTTHAGTVAPVQYAVDFR